MFRLLSNWRAADISRRAGPRPREEHALEENRRAVFPLPFAAYAAVGAVIPHCDGFPAAVVDGTPCQG